VCLFSKPKSFLFSSSADSFSNGPRPVFFFFLLIDGDSPAEMRAVRFLLLMCSFFSVLILRWRRSLFPFFFFSCTIFADFPPLGAFFFHIEDFLFFSAQLLEEVPPSTISGSRFFPFSLVLFPFSSALGLDGFSVLSISCRQFSCDCEVFRTLLLWSFFSPPLS